MSEPRDLNLERLGDRSGRRAVQLPKIAHVAFLSDSSSPRMAQAAYEALIDAVFTAPGALEWLTGLRRAVAAMLADKDSASHVPATRAAGLRIWRP